MAVSSPARTMASARNTGPTRPPNCRRPITGCRTGWRRTACGPAGAECLVRPGSAWYRELPAVVARQIARGGAGGVAARVR